MDDSFKIDFIGIGTAKSGTSWLFYALGQHPEICLSEPKDISYFNHLDHPKILTKSGNPTLVNKNHTKPFSWYKRHFRHCPEKTVRGEFSPFYLFDEKAPNLIKQFFPKVKLLVCLRNPIDRAYSFFWSRTVYTKTEHRTFEKAIHENKSYMEQGLYHKYLNRYLQYFDKDQIMVVLFEDFLNQSEDEVIKVLKFLGADTNVKLDFARVSKNSSKRSRYTLVEPLMRCSSIFLRDLNQVYLLRLLRKIGIKKLFIKLGTVSFEYPNMNPSTRKYLRSVFEDDIKKLERLLGCDLSNWK